MSDAERERTEEPLPSEVKVGTLMNDSEELAERSEERAPARSTARRDLARSAQGHDRHGSGAEQHPSGFERTVSAIRTVIPFVQKVLPLLDGNVALAVANFLAPRLQAPAVDLHPMEASVAKMRAELTELRQGVTTRDAALKRIEEQVDAVKDSLERSVMNQQEVSGGLQRVQKRLTTLTVVGLFLLIASIGMNVVLLVRVLR
jgi:hypothetical protein